jgi:hypothetical protein
MVETAWHHLKTGWLKEKINVNLHIATSQATRLKRDDGAVNKVCAFFCLEGKPAERDS